MKKRYKQIKYFYKLANKLDISRYNCKHHSAGFINGEGDFIPVTSHSDYLEENGLIEAPEEWIKVINATTYVSRIDENPPTQKQLKTICDIFASCVKYIPKIKRSPESVRLEIHGDGLDVPMKHGYRPSIIDFLFHFDPSGELVTYFEGNL